MAPSGPEQHGWWWGWSPQLFCMWGCSEVPGPPGPQQLLCLQSLRQPWTGLIGSQVGFCWHPHTDVRQHTQVLQSPRHKGEDHPRGVYSWFLTFQGQRALSALPPTRHWVMEHLLMFVKGHQDEKETQRMLNTKPMVPDTPIHHCLPWATSFRLPFHHWIVGPPGWLLVD